MDAKGKVALVTGSSKGIGRAMAIKLAEMGAKVAINYLSFGKEKEMSQAEEVAKRITEMGREAILIEADVSSFDQAAFLVSRTVDAFGGIDILVNNAGIYGHMDIFNTTYNYWDRMIKVNLYGAFCVVKHALKHMVDRKQGKIINITSVAGIRGSHNNPAYGASKAGLIGLTLSLAWQLSRYNITVNAIAPSAVDTDMLRGAFTPEEIKKRANSIPLGRIARPEEIADGVEFLVKNDYITGHVLVIGGGEQ